MCFCLKISCKKYLRWSLPNAKKQSNTIKGCVCFAWCTVRRSGVPYFLWFLHYTYLCIVSALQCISLHVGRLDLGSISCLNRISYNSSICHHREGFLSFLLHFSKKKFSEVNCLIEKLSRGSNSAIRLQNKN